MSDPNRKTQRSFYCRDNLWDLFEVMARDLGCSMDYLLNEAMRHYAQSRNYALDTGHPAPPPVVAPSASAMPAAPPPPPSAPPPAAMPSGFVRAATQPVLGNNANDYHRGFEHRTFERLPAAPPPPPPPGAPSLTTPMNAVAPVAAYQAGGAPSSGQFQAAHLASSPQFPSAPVPSPRQGPPPPPPKTITAPMPPGFIDLDEDAEDLIYQPPAPPAPPAPPGFEQRPHSFSAHPAVPAPPPPAFDQRPPSFAAHPAAAPQKAAPQPNASQGQGQGQLSLIFNGQRYPIAKDKFIVGRASQITDLTIRDGNVSRQHCAVIQRGGQYFIKDLESTNGIEYQGVRIDSKKIDEGDVFNICEYVMRFTFR
jgi:hypothetical protein